MSHSAARWIAFVAACLSGILALDVALSLGLFAWNGVTYSAPDLGPQSRQAAAAAAAATVSVIAQIIEKASRPNEDR
jgi:ABC-type phosphate transport system auxiliary subunit